MANVCRPSCSAVFSAIALVFALSLQGCAVTAAEKYDPEQAQQEIWSKEQAIYKARGDGDLQTYINHSSDRYMGWPPGWDKPSNLDKLREGAKGFVQYKQEELTMQFGGITFSGDTAIIYYSTHRTRKPTGEVVDERFEVIHVWSLEAGEWKLLGSMGRSPVT
ncbi:MAG: nuclear transport factor 2 family protein [Lysobacterales bacterium]